MSKRTAIHIILRHGQNLCMATGGGGLVRVGVHIHRLKGNKETLVTEKLAEISLAELNDPVNATNEDEKRRGKHEPEEGHQRLVEPIARGRAAGSKNVVGKSDAEGHEGDDLEDESSERDVLSNVNVMLSGAGAG